MSKQAKLLNYLSSGAEFSARQISGSFGLKNPHDAIYQLRNQGICIYGNKATLSDGTETTKYRIGKPNKRMLRLANMVYGANAFTRT